MAQTGQPFHNFNRDHLNSMRKGIFISEKKSNSTLNDVENRTHKFSQSLTVAAMIYPVTNVPTKMWIENKVKQ